MIYKITKLILNHSEKIIRELPHEPPMHRTDSMDQLVERLRLTLPLNRNDTGQIRKAFTFDFKQPISDYLAFKVRFRAYQKGNSLFSLI